MNNIAIKNAFVAGNATRKVPATPRGRALHTVDWFMNGQRRLSDYDNRGVNIRSLAR
jgi:hypothetical protein